MSEQDKLAEAIEDMITRHKDDDVRSLCNQLAYAIRAEIAATCKECLQVQQSATVKESLTTPPANAGPMHNRRKLVVKYHSTAYGYAVCEYCVLRDTGSCLKHSTDGCTPALGDRGYYAYAPDPHPQPPHPDATGPERVWRDATGNTYMEPASTVGLIQYLRSDLHSQAMAEMESRKDAAYLERNRVVAAMAAMAISLGCKAGTVKTTIASWSEDWHGCVYIETPVGQCSWHYHDSHAYLFDWLPHYDGTYDGHTTEQKYERLQTLRPDRQISERDEQIKQLNHLLRPLNDCPQCRGSGEVVASDEGGIVVRCDCWSASSKAKDEQIRQLRDECACHFNTGTTLQQTIGKLKADFEAAKSDRNEWKRNCEMYSIAWNRECGKRFPKTHLIDELVLRTQQLRELEENIGANCIRGSGGAPVWHLPYFNADGTHTMLPIDQWKAKRQEAAKELAAVKERAGKPGVTEISAQVKAWADYNFGSRTLVDVALKVCEESGELAGATIKQHQRIRLHEDQPARAMDAVGDIVIALMNYCTMNDWNFLDIVRNTWGEVQKRDWKANPNTAHIDASPAQPASDVEGVSSSSGEQGEGKHA